MGFDQNSVPKDLRPLNIAPTVADESHIAPTTSGRAPDVFYPTQNTSPPPPMAVYYSDTSGLPGLGYMNLGGPVPSQVPAWTGRMPSPMGPPSFTPNFAPRPTATANANATVAGSASSLGTGTPSDQAGEEGGGEDSVSGKKVKFLCSFGGKILPRPSDSTLRYVGGHTRIISFRRDVTFPELVQKMVDTYGQPVVIKYQLPYEDLDALVSVSCPDDLDNMMEEYAKLLENSPDGSVKLRVFLFSASEIDSSGLVHLGDFHDSGLKYVDAVNGIVEGSGGGGGITRKESIASVASTQNSDVSATEVLDSAVGHDVTAPPSSNMFSPRSDSAVSTENRVVDTSAPTFTVPNVVTPQSAHVQREVELGRTVTRPVHGQPLQGYDLSHTTMNFPPPPSPYLGGYVDHQDTFGRADYQKLPAQVVYANSQGLGSPRPVIVQTQYRDNAPSMLSQQFVAPITMTIAPPTSHLSLNPNVVQPQRVVAVPADHNYPNAAYPAQVGGGYVWHQVTPQDHVPLSEGWMPHLHGVPSSSVDCYMCQKALPHAHSDSVVQDQKDTVDTNPVYQSLRLDDVSRIHEATQSQMVMGQTPYTAPRGNAPVSRPEETVGIVSSQPKQELLVNKPVGGDSTAVSGTICQNASTQDGVRKQVDLMDNLDIKPPDVHHTTSEHSKSPVDHFKKDDFLEQSHDLLPPLIENINQAEATTDIPSTIVHVSQQHNVHAVDPFGGLQSNPSMAEMISISSHLRDDASGSAMTSHAGFIVTPTNNNVHLPVSPHNWDSPNSLFSNQDPWNMRPDAHFPPPKPTKITMRRESSSKELQEVNPTLEPYGAKSTLESTKAEDRIKQQLQATAEGVAASVLHSSATSNAELSPQESNVSTSDISRGMEVQNSDAHIQSKMEAMNIKPEKANLGFPMSDGMGRLQIIKNSDLEELRELGSGTFGTVYHGKWRGTDVAIKRINDRCFAGKPSEQDRMRDDFWNEAIKLADLHHPNVVAFYGVVLDGPGGSVATVTEYMVNGSLRTALQKNERNLDKRKRLLIAMDVAFGMEYLHSKNIVHFDLKSDNLLVNLRDPHRPICKVGDLGLSKVKCQTLISGGVRGTLPWMAPELLNGSSSLVSEKVDVFSFGIVMWELLTGEEPYADLHYGAIIGGIVSNTLRPLVPETCDQDWRTLMERCWSAEPSERPNFTEIANELRTMAAKVPPKVQIPATNAKPSA